MEKILVIFLKIHEGNTDYLLLFFESGLKFLLVSVKVNYESWFLSAAEISIDYR